MIAVINLDKIFYLLRYLMGQVTSCCNMNLFNELYQQYGERFVQIILAEKSKLLIGQKFNEVVVKFKQIFASFRQKISQMVGNKKNEANKLYGELKQKVDSNVPGGIKMLETAKGQSIQQISGYNKLQSKIGLIQEQSFKKLDSQQQNLSNQINTKKQDMVNKVEQKRPKIEGYQALPGFVKSFLLKQGEEKFKQQILQNKTQIDSEISGQFNQSTANSLLGKINPESLINGQIGQVFNVMSSLIGGSGGISSVLKFFG